MRKFLTGLVCGVIIAGCGFSYAADSIKLVINGEVIVSDVPPTIVEGRTMVPLRIVADAFNADTVWDGVARTVYINTREDQIDPVPVDLSNRKVNDTIQISGGTLTVDSLGYTGDGESRRAVARLTIRATHDYVPHQSPLLFVRGFVVNNQTLSGIRSVDAPLVFGSGHTATFNIQVGIGSLDNVDGLLINGIGGVVRVTN